MYEIIGVLEQKYGWRITYEDPPFEHMADLRNVTHKAYKAAHSGMAPAHVAAQQIYVAADNIRARDALMLILNACDAKAIEKGMPAFRITWTMLYGPAEKVYYFNLHSPQINVSP